MAINPLSPQFTLLHDKPNGKPTLKNDSKMVAPTSPSYSATHEQQKVSPPSSPSLDERTLKNLSYNKGLNEENEKKKENVSPPSESGEEDLIGPLEFSPTPPTQAVVEDVAHKVSNVSKKELVP